METPNMGMHSPIPKHLPDLSLQDALASLERMPHPPSVENLKRILRECRKHKNPAHALRFHAYLLKTGLEAHTLLGNHLVPMLVEVGSLSDAQHVFDKLVDRNEYSWTSLITGYIECGELQQAFALHQKMQEDSVHPSGRMYVTLLKACASLKDTERGQELHADIARKGILERDVFVGNTLVDMYAKCGLLAKAQAVFNTLPVRDAVSWNALIAGYTEHSLAQDALKYFEQMQLEGICPDSVTFLLSLKACRSIGDIDKGQEIHAQIVTQGLLERYPFVGNTLVDMYAKCGLLAKAQEVFDKLPVQNAVSWNALIAGYTEHGLCQDALNCFEQMQLEGIHPDSVTFVCSLKACGCVGAIDKGREIHTQVATEGLLERYPFVGNTLVDMYAKCGLLAEALEVFDKLQVRDAVSWNALMSGYAKNGLGQDALICYEQMQSEGVFPNSVTYICILKACGSIAAIEKGQEIHAQIATKGLLERDLLVGNTLVDMYAKCGLLAKAQEVFDKLPVRDAVSWNSLITGYADHGCGPDALNCFEQMQLEGLSPDLVTFVCSLKACGGIGAIDRGREIHAQIATKGLLERYLVVGNALIDMYAKCGLLAKAQEVFDKLSSRNAVSWNTLVDMYAKCGLLAKAQEMFDKSPVQDVVSWNALISGYAEHGLCEDAVNCFEQMQLEGLCPNGVTFVCILKACGSVGAIDKGQETHCQIATKGLLEIYPFLGNTLVDMYAKLGLLAKAQEVFDKLPVRDVVSWNALISGYAEHGLGQDALNCFEQMQLEGVSPVSVTFICILKACGSIGDIDMGREIHAQIVTKGLLERYIFVGNTLVDMYASCGLLAKAQDVFDKLGVRDAVSWNALIAGYTEHGLCQNALACFEQMQLEGISPSVLTYVDILKACGSIGAIDKGQEIHAQIALEGLLEKHIVVGNTLIDMYVNCGLLAKAQEVFDKLPDRDRVSWNTLITGYAQLGESENAFLLLDKMKTEDIKPDGVTFLSILAVCSHTGLVEKGWAYFEAMTKDYSITPNIEHHNCMVDLLSRAGQLDKAVVMIKKMPFNPNLVSWRTVLGACQKWGDVELGRWAFEHAVELDKMDARAYVLMSNIYADAHMQKEAKQVDLMRFKEQAWKKTGQNWCTDVGGFVHSFLVGDKDIPKATIYMQS